MKKRLLALLLALAMGLTLAACSAPAAEDPTPSVDPTESPTASTEPAIEADLSQDVLSFAGGDLVHGEPLVTVNGQVVPNTLFLYWLSYTASYYESMLYYYGMTVADYAPVILEEACSLAAYYTTLSQKAQELGCILTDDQQAAVDEAMAVGSEDHQRRLDLYGLTNEDLLQIYSLTDYYDNLMAMLIPAPTEEDLNNYVYQVKHILISTAASAADGVITLNTGDTVEYAGTVEEYNAAALAKAEDLLAQILAAEDMGATFDTLMHEHSEDGRDAEGNLGAPDGYTATPGEMVAEFEETAFAIGIGEVSDVVESTYGYHIILRGEVENIQDYTEDYNINQMDSLVTQWLTEAEVERSDALETLDVAQFYERLVAWQNAYMEANTVAE